MFNASHILSACYPTSSDNKILACSSSTYTKYWIDDETIHRKQEGSVQVAHFTNKP